MSRIWPIREPPGCDLAIEGHPAGGRAGLPDGAAGQWCRVSVGLPGHSAWWVKLEAADHARGHVVREVFLGPMRQTGARSWRSTLMHMPARAGGLDVSVFSVSPVQTAQLTLRLKILTRRGATAALLAHGWRKLPRVLRGSTLGLGGRIRGVLGQAPARDGEAPPFVLWQALYAPWGEAERAALAHSIAAAPPIGVVLVGTDPAALSLSRRSLETQWLGASRVDQVATPADWRGAGYPWTLVLQAGEVLLPHGLACFAHARHRAPWARGFYADTLSGDPDTPSGDDDSLPVFKPRPDPWLLTSTLPTSGACLFSTRSCLDTAGAGDALAWRRRTALALGEGGIDRIPAILTRVPRALAPDVEPQIAPDFTHPSVTLIIPSSLRYGRSLHCLRKLIARTAYAGRWEILLVVSRIDRSDRIQARHMREISKLQLVRAIDAELQVFNYSTANNIGAREASGEYLLLLNDDVVPLEADWLHRLVAMCSGGSGANADVVGARLLYGNGTVQHGGVIMGLAKLCEHAFRFTEIDDGGPGGIALLDRQVSAVTGACLLVRRSLYETIGGMDPSYAIALNDVDLCLRAGRQGARIVYAARIALTHYESLSLGRHYAGERSVHEAQEVRRLSQCWHEIIADDPHYTPLASLEPGREFQPGFPARMTALSWIEGDTAGRTC